MKAKAVEQIVALLESRGWQASGRTDAETVRVATSRSPVFGGLGGELRTFGGRLRFAKGEDRVTVGPRTVNFYKVKDGSPSDFTQFKSGDLAGILAHLEPSQ